MSGRPLLKLTLPARAESLKPMRDALCAALDRVGVQSALRERLKLAVDEAAANIIRHAYGGSGKGEFQIIVSLRRGTLRFVLRDAAPAVDPATIRPRDLADCRPGGLGINFIDETMDDWCLRPRPCCGNQLLMSKRLRQREDGEGK